MSHRAVRIILNKEDKSEKVKKTLNEDERKKRGDGNNYDRVRPGRFMIRIGTTVSLLTAQIRQQFY